VAHARAAWAARAAQARWGGPTVDPPQIATPPGKSWGGVATNYDGQEIIILKALIKLPPFIPFIPPPPHL